MPQKQKEKTYYQPPPPELNQCDCFLLYQGIRNSRLDGVQNRSKRRLTPDTLVTHDGDFVIISRRVTITEIKRERGEMVGKGPDGVVVSFPCGGYTKDSKKIDE